MLLARIGSNGKNPLSITTDIDASLLGGFVLYGYFFIAIVQVISILCGEKSPVLV